MCYISPHMAWLDTMTHNTTIGSGQPYYGDRAAVIRDMVLNNPNLTQLEVANRVGCVRSNVSQVMSRFLRRHHVDSLEEFQADKANIYDVVQHSLLASISPEKIEKAGLLQTVTAAAILEDKARLVRGQATSINVTALVDVANLLRQRMTAPTGNVTIVSGTPEDVG